MKIDEFLKNPQGKGAIIPGKEQLLMSLDYRLSLIEKNKKIEMTIYTDKSDVYYHFLIPSENKDRDICYDVIIKFKQTEDADSYDQTYKQYQIEFFSNCPSFTYGYAYVANINGYLIKELAGKYDEAVLKYPPVSKNPGLLFGYEKSIYFACRYIMNNKKILLKSYVESHGTKLTAAVLKSIRHMNKIEEEYKRADKIMRREKRDKQIGTDDKTKKRKADIITKIENGDKQGVNTVKKTTAKKPGNGKIKPMKKKK
jgi:hypothetical protein